MPCLARINLYKNSTASDALTSMGDENLVRSSQPSDDGVYMWTFLFFKTNHRFNLFVNIKISEIGLPVGKTILFNLLCFQQ